MGFLAEGTVAHGAGAEPFDDIIFRFDFFDRDAAARRIDEFQQIAQTICGRRIDPVGIFAVQVIVIGAAGFLQQLDCLRVDDMRLAALVILVDIPFGQCVAARKCRFMTQRVFSGYFRKADAADGAGCIDEIFLDQVAADTDGFKNLGAMITVDGRNAHLGHDGQHAVDGSPDIVFPCFFTGYFSQLLFRRQFLDGFQGDIGIDRRDAVADEGAEMMDFPRFP